MTFNELLPPYGAIVADPPWSYDQVNVFQKTTRMGKARIGQPAASKNYSTMTMADIAALPVEQLAADDAHLYLWVTVPTLFGQRGSDQPGPVDIIESWGFTYRTMLTWGKEGTLGMGFYFRGDTEHVLFATRGKAPIPPDKRRSNLFIAGKGRHSGKPPSLLDAVEQVSPGPYVELFARQPRLGWDSWGLGEERAVGS